MLKVSKLTDYGTVVMTYMARAPDHVHSAANVAGKTGLATPTVSKILKVLARESLLISLRGPQGGYMLARAPRDISLAQVIGALEGPIGMTECGSSPGLCLHEPDCSIRTNWRTINRMVLEAFSRITLEQMTRPIGQAAQGLIKAPAGRAQRPEAGANRLPAGAQR